MIGTGYGHYGRAPIARENTTRSPKPESCRYLGAIEAVSNDAAPSLAKLQSDAYILTLPTGKQLQLIDSEVDAQGAVLAARNDAVLAEIAGLLDQYNVLANRYNQFKQTSTGHTAPLEEEITKILAAIDKKLESAVNHLGSARSGAYQALRHGLRDAEALRGLRTDWRYWEMLGVSPAEYDRVADNPDAIGDWLDKGFSAKQALSFRNAGYDHPGEVLHFRNTGITGPMAKQLIRRGYTREFFEETLGVPANLAQAGFCLQDHHDAWAENQGREFGSGAFSTVTARFFIDRKQDPSRAPGNGGSGSTERVFKPDKFLAAPAKAQGKGPAKIAVPQPGESVAGNWNESCLLTLQVFDLTRPETLENPRIAGRNLASHRLAKAFGTDVIVESELAISAVPVTDADKSAYQAGTGQQAPDLVFMPGIMMEKAEETCRTSPDLKPAEPDATTESGAEIYRNMTWLQLLDQISGQIDRHEGNFRMTAEGKVKGIDNDQCWPPLVGKSSDFGILFAGWNWRLTHENGFPRIVDEEMVARLCGFTNAERKRWKAGQLPKSAMTRACSRARETLAQAVRGCITRAEMEAGQERLRALQAYLLGDSVKVISDWRKEYAAAARS
jgi:hypothetical protein